MNSVSSAVVTCRDEEKKSKKKKVVKIPKVSSHGGGDGWDGLTWRCGSCVVPSLNAHGHTLDEGPGPITF